MGRNEMGLQLETERRESPLCTGKRRDVFHNLGNVAEVTILEMMSHRGSARYAQQDLKSSPGMPSIPGALAALRLAIKSEISDTDGTRKSLKKIGLWGGRPSIRAGLKPALLAACSPRLAKKLLIPSISMPTISGISVPIFDLPRKHELIKRQAARGSVVASLSLLLFLLEPPPPSKLLVNYLRSPHESSQPDIVRIVAYLRLSRSSRFKESVQLFSRSHRPDEAGNHPVSKRVESPLDLLALGAVRELTVA